MSFIWERCSAADLLVFAQEHARLKRICLDPINTIKRQRYAMLTWLIAGTHLKGTLDTQSGGEKESMTID